MKSNSEINFLVDAMIIQTLLDDGSLSKTAGLADMGEQIIEKVKHYVGNNVDSKDKTGSFLNIAGPGLLAVIMSGMGLPWLGTLIGFAMRFFHIDVAGILRKIVNSLKGIVTGDKETSSAQVDAVVQDAVQEHTPPSTEEEAAAARKEDPKLFGNDQQKANDPTTVAQALRSARMVKLGMITFAALEDTHSLESRAGLLDIFKSQKAGSATALSKILGWIFKIILASCGLMVAGDVANLALGRPSALNDTVKDGKPVEQNSTPAISKPRTTQTKFKLQPSYHETSKSGKWKVNIDNNAASISNMLIGFAKQVYQDLDGLENEIMDTAGFRVIRNRIINYNQFSAGDSWVDIPKEFDSEKDIVDHFIDDVAKSSS